MKESVMYQSQGTSDTIACVTDDCNCACTHSAKAKPDRSEKVRNCCCRSHEHDTETSHA